ncbi:unnamed protein product [Paramecium pentaurelia]|uniref:Tetratricopeptide repeat protein n=1 Tax=Paramecium pentaurelia TaxID=43138 RepID=A0A8S1SXY6_9CILI|nr:unnamed protein product [Paramecium pentaurelia]
MLTEKSLDDSLNDSLQPSQLKNLEEEFETNQMINQESSVKLVNNSSYNYVKPQCSYRYTYSSEEHSSDEEESQSSKISQQPQFLTFGQIDSNLGEIKELIKQHNYQQAYQQLVRFQEAKQDQLSQENKQYLQYLFTQIYFGLQMYREMFQIANQIINQDQDYVDHTLDMLINASLLINNLELALQYQLQLINRSNYDQNEQLRLGKIYMLLEKPVEAYFSFLGSYKAGNQEALEQLIEIGHTVDQRAFPDLAYKYINSKNQKNQKVLAKTLFNLAKIEYPNKSSLQHQEQGYSILVQINGVNDQNTIKALCNLACMRLQFQQWQEAEKDFELCLQIISQLEGQANRQFIFCLQQLSQCQYQSKKYEQSLETLERCFNLASQSTNVIKKEFLDRILFNIAYVKIIMKQNFSGTLSKLIATQNSVLLNEIGIILQKHEYIDEAIELYNEALNWSSNDQHVLISFNLAGCYGLKKDYTRSVDLYKQCSIEMDDRLKCDIERKISQVYYSCSKFRESLFHLKRAYQLAKEFNLDCISEIKQELKKF